jgi:hypothetical protein
MVNILPSSDRPHGATVFGLLTNELAISARPRGERYIHAAVAQHKVLNFVKWRARIYTGTLAGWTAPNGNPEGYGRLYHGFLGLPYSQGMQGSGLLAVASMWPITDGVGNVNPALMGFYTVNNTGGAPVWTCVVRSPNAGEGTHVITSTVAVTPDTWYELRIERVQSGADAGDLRFYIDNVLVPDGANTYTFDALDMSIPDGADGATPAVPLYIGKCHYAGGNVYATGYEDTQVWIDYCVSKFIKSLDAPFTSQQ